MVGQVRLQKVLAERGLASRRGAEALIAQGLVKVNGRVVTEMGLKVDPDKDLIEVDQAGLEAKAQDLAVLMLNKPEGIVTTRAEGEGRSVMDLVSAHPLAAQMNPVGRLDKDSCGLLLLTNDGRLQYAIVAPESHLDKEYEVSLSAPAMPGQLARMAEGVRLDGRPTLPARIKPINNTRFLMTLTEGRNRQIRRMAEKVGLEVARLRRLRVGPVELGGLAEGKWRALSPAELKSLRSAAGMAKVNKKEGA